MSQSLKNVLNTLVCVLFIIIIKSILYFIISFQLMTFKYCSRFFHSFLQCRSPKPGLCGCLDTSSQWTPFPAHGAEFIRVPCRCVIPPSDWCFMDILLIFSFCSSEIQTHGLLHARVSFCYWVIYPAPYLFINNIASLTLF